MSQATPEQTLELAIQHHQAGRIPQAEAIYRQILAQQPNHAGALHLLGLIAGQAGRIAEAEQLIRRAIDLQPVEFLFQVNLAALLLSAGQAEKSVALFRHVALLHPLQPEAHFNFGTAMQASGHLDDAITSYREALRLKPDYAGAHNNLGNALKSRGNLDEARASFQRALEINPAFVQALANLGALLRQTGQVNEAITCLQKALSLSPDNGAIQSDLAGALTDAWRIDEAIAAYRRAIELMPASSEAHNNLGNALKARGLLDEAITAYREALRLQPDLAEAFSNMAAVLELQAQAAEAITLYRQALKLKPDHARIHGNLLYTLHFDPASDARSLFEEHREWNRRHAAPLHSAIQPHSNDRDPQRTLRIGYVSAEFYNHAVGRFMLPLLESHNHQAFEVFCYADGTVSDSMTQRLRSHANHWKPITGLSDDQLAARIRQDRIDILVDLSMHLRGNRLLTFARKPAPVQVTYLAYCSTTGLDTIDYRITDPHLDPPDSDTSCYSEQTVRLPETYWCYGASPEAPAVNDLPAKSAGHFTFGCLNTFSKASPNTLAAWCRILASVPGSHLLLHAHPGGHRDRTRRFFAARGVDSSRIEFTGHLTMPEYFQLYHRIDLCLDPFPYAGGTTTCDALWMGVPVVTLRGRTAVGRGGVSILSNVGITELVSTDEGHYARTAVEWAYNLPKLVELRATLRPRMKSSPLMDAPRFARNLEAAYRQMWINWSTGAKP